MHFPKNHMRLRSRKFQILGLDPRPPPNPVARRRQKNSTIHESYLPRSPPTTSADATAAWPVHRRRRCGPRFLYAHQNTDARAPPADGVRNTTKQSPFSFSFFFFFSHPFPLHAAAAEPWSGARFSFFLSVARALRSRPVPSLSLTRILPANGRRIIRVLSLSLSLTRVFFFFLLLMASTAATIIVVVVAAAATSPPSTLSDD